jgi:hypothetical protein
MYLNIKDAPVVLHSNDREIVDKVMNGDKKWDDNGDSPLKKKEKCLQIGTSAWQRDLI